MFDEINKLVLQKFQTWTKFNSNFGKKRGTMQASIKRKIKSLNEALKPLEIEVDIKPIAGLIVANR